MDKHTFSIWGWILIVAIIITAMIAFSLPFAESMVEKMTDAFADTDYYEDVSDQQLSVPTNLSLEAYTFSFGSVPNADRYEITIRGESIDVTVGTTGTSVDLSHILNGSRGIVTITIVAKDSTGSFENSLAISLIEDLG